MEYQSKSLLNLTFISIGLLISNFSNIQIYVSFWLFISVLWVFGILSAIKGEIKPIPLVGNLYQKLFKSF